MSPESQRIAIAKAHIAPCPEQSHKWAAWRHDSISILLNKGFSWDECAQAIDWPNLSNIRELYAEDKATARNQWINETIAKAVGLIECDRGGWQHLIAFMQSKDGSCGHDNCYPPGNCPNYLTDLNACHEMEKVLKGEQVTEYLYQLVSVCDPTTVAGYFATAAQRCEAFLRTLGKWEESP